MSSQPISFGCVEEELLETLLAPDANPYPWNPAEAEAEAYLNELERGFMENWSEQEVTRGSQWLFAELNTCWASETSMVDEVKELYAKLSERFAAHVPHDWLENIAQKAHEVVAANLSLSDQLVHSVQELLPNWYQEDLQILARPYAVAMRGDSMLETVRPVEWAELSEVERVRLSMVIARYALNQLKDHHA